MPFRDSYTNFSFNDISSESMKVWITNSRDLSFLGSPNFSDTFVNPISAQIRYHTNTTINNSEITLKCIAIGVTMMEWRAIQNWLSPFVLGKLQLDFNINTYYEVKISKPITGAVFVAAQTNDQEGDIYNIEFSVSFATISDWAALGPPVVTSVNNSIMDFQLVQIPLNLRVPDQHSNLQNRVVALDLTYEQFFNQHDSWYEVDFWKVHITDNTISAKVDEALIESLLYNLSAININLLSDSINNRYSMPMIYNKTTNLNTKLPVYKTKDGKTTISPLIHHNRVYLTSPTVIHDKVIYLDAEFFNEVLAKDDKYFDNINYFLLDNTIEPVDSLAPTISFDKLRSNYIAYMQKSTIKNTETNLNENVMIMSHEIAENDYDIGLNTIITPLGIALFGMSVMFVANSDRGYESSPFYYLEEENTYAVMNAGAYDSYPNLYVNLGTNTKIKISKEEELQYNYHLSVQNAALDFNGKTGFVLFNNALAESASLKSSAGNTNVVVDSVNNGVLNIHSGHPELMKIRIFGVGESKYANIQNNVANGKVASVKVKHIFFQPVGEFKYSRNGSFAALLFTDVFEEQAYNKNTYPLVNRYYLNSSSYGSKLMNYNFSINAFISKVKVSQHQEMWVLTLPEKDYVCKYTVDRNKKIFPYVYLSLCDYTNLTVDADTSAESYFSMQTRDAY